MFLVTFPGRFLRFLQRFQERSCVPDNVPRNFSGYLTTFLPRITIGMLDTFLGSRNVWKLSKWAEPPEFLKTFLGLFGKLLSFLARIRRKFFGTFPEFLVTRGPWNEPGTILGKLPGTQKY